MSVKRVIDYQGLITDGDMSGNVTSDATNVLHLDRVGYEISYTGTPTGNFTVEVSNTGNHWQEMTLSTPISAAGSASNHFIDCETSCKLIRLKYTRSSGTGTLNVAIVAKSISG